MYNDGGGLYLYCRNYGSKEWIFRYTSPLTNTRRKQSFGSFPAISLGEARDKANSSRKLLEDRIDPINHALERLALDKDRLREQQHKAANTVENVFTIYKREELQNRKDKRASVERVFKKDVFPVIGGKPIHEVTRLDIKNVLGRPLRRGSKRMANETLSNLKQFFGYADDEEFFCS